MKGRWIYAAAASLLGNLTSLLHPAIAVIFSLLALFLLKRNILTKQNMTILILIYLSLIIRSELAAEYNRTSLTGNEGEFEITLSESVKIDGDLLTVLIELTEKKEKLAARYKIKSEAEQKILSDHLRIGMNAGLMAPYRLLQHLQILIPSATRIT